MSLKKDVRRWGRYTSDYEARRRLYGTALIHLAINSKSHMQFREDFVRLQWLQLKCMKRGWLREYSVKDEFLSVYSKTAGFPCEISYKIAEPLPDGEFPF